MRDDCDLALQTEAALKSHLLTDTHKDRVLGIEKPPPSKSSLAVAAVRADAKANKTYYCSPCDKAFDNDYSLTRHQATPLHARRLLASR